LPAQSPQVLREEDEERVRLGFGGERARGEREAKTDVMSCETSGARRVSFDAQRRRRKRERERAGRTKVSFWLRKKVLVSHVEPSKAATGVPQFFHLGAPLCTSAGTFALVQRQIEMLRTRKQSASVSEQGRGECRRKRAQRTHPVSAKSTAKTPPPAALKPVPYAVVS